ncbi:astacin-like metalloendopeptidase [Xyrichtys novacula]|uniref:Metalloendopeptidase n=1 Tax=Xyrichtys novacula TaxID=13765 RepID=A0AAV1G8W5_XYRNO|nr:astacin-like metalloendopeptidase [Xyrichtys novacula]
MREAEPSQCEIMLQLLLTALLLVQLIQNADSGPIQEARKALRMDWFLRALRYMETNPETLDELMAPKGYVLSEGDMVMPRDRNAVEAIWPTREIPYVISEDLESRTDDILSAMAMLSKHSCVSFHKRTSETNYLLFKASKGCASYVGFIGGEQPVFVGPPCIVGNIAHEILHALGFHHEHTRTDREQHISVLTHNIMSGMGRNFEMREGETFGLPYDITSILHYGSGFFSANGLPTIVPNSDVKGMGQRDGLTEMDIQRVKQLYSCDVPERELETESGSVGKEEDTSYIYRMLYRDRHSPKNHRTTTAAPSASLQLTAAATRGRSNIS